MAVKIYIEKSIFGFSPISEEEFVEKAKKPNMGNAKISCFWSEIDGSKEPVEAYLVFYVGLCFDDNDYNRKCEKIIRLYLDYIISLTGLKISTRLAPFD